MRKTLALLMLLTPIAKVPANAQRPEIVREVRAQLNAQKFDAAAALLEAARTRSGVSSEYLEALSWMGRAHLAAKNYDKAAQYAEETRKHALELLKRRKLDDDSSLPLALGAAIEVEGQRLAAQDQRSEAVSFLREELRRYRESSIRTRIQKNLHLISLEGQRAPLLNIDEYIGPEKPKSLTQLKGKPVVLYFWAHWCGDCKQQGPVLARLAKEFAASGLVVIGPTQPYGYGEAGADLARPDEIKYIEQIRQKYYAIIPGMAVPVSEENFKSWGSSTTPTLVLIDRQGLVRLYHPGRMTEAELRPHLARLIQ